MDEIDAGARSEKVSSADELLRVLEASSGCWTSRGPWRTSS